MNNDNDNDNYDINNPDDWMPGFKFHSGGEKGAAIKCMQQIIASHDADIKQEQLIKKGVKDSLINSAILIMLLTPIMWYYTQDSWPVKAVWSATMLVVSLTNLFSAYCVTRYHNDRIKTILGHRTLSHQIKTNIEKQP